jgi:hypothetical protein
VKNNNTWEKCGKAVEKNSVKKCGKNSMGKVWKISRKNVRKIS